MHEFSRAYHTLIWKLLVTTLFSPIIERLTAVAETTKHSIKYVFWEMLAIRNV